MPLSADLDWTSHAARLADELEATGALRAPAWKAAVAATPRHLLVPNAYQQQLPSYQWRLTDLTTPDALDLVYSSTTLVTSLDDRDAPLSSSTKPDLILQMLELLNVQDEHKVLAVGTGSGYTTALLCHRLGDSQVFSVDIERDLVEAAQQRLAGIGRHPTLAVVDGERGLPQHAPYHRIMATCSVPAVPWAWAEQLTSDGAVLVNVMPGAINAGNLALLHRRGDRLEGTFTDRWASFMAMRHHDAAPAASTRGTDTPQTRTTSTPPNPWWHNTVVWLLAQFHGLPAGVTVGMEPDPDTGQPVAGTLTAPDGSWACVRIAPIDSSRWQVTEAGPTPLWAAIEQAHDRYQQADCPSWPRFGLTVTEARQWVWIDQPSQEIGTLPTA